MLFGNVSVGWFWILVLVIGEVAVPFTLGLIMTFIGGTIFYPILKFSAKLIYLYIPFTIIEIIVGAVVIFYAYEYFLVSVF